MTMLFYLTLTVLLSLTHPYPYVHNSPPPSFHTLSHRSNKIHPLCRLSSTSAPSLDENIGENIGENIDQHQHKSPKTGVLLLNLGGPSNSSDVEGFLYNLFADPDIIRLPKFLSSLQKPLAYFISSNRAPKSQKAYDSIGGGSPIVKYTNAQADLIREKLQQKYNMNVETFVGMRYWFPFTEQALDDVKKANLDALVILPLYPQFSVSTSGSSLKLLQEEFAKHPQDFAKLKHTVIPSWFDRPGYISCVSSLIKKELQSFSEEEKNSGGPLHVLFSAHGVPQSYIENGDPYQGQIQECFRLISDTLPKEVTTHLSYQSRVGPIEWLKPYTDTVLPELGQKGIKNLVVVPISFVSEHIETLEEIDIEYKALALESGIKNWRRCPALNTDKLFIEDMADMIVEALEAPGVTLTEACVMNNCDGLTMPKKLLEVETMKNDVGLKEGFMDFLNGFYKGG